MGLTWVSLCTCDVFFFLVFVCGRYDDAMRRAHNVLVAVQDAVYKYEGSINKFLMDDKGSTLIAVFGLPPLAHTNDVRRWRALLLCVFHLRAPCVC